MLPNSGPPSRYSTPAPSTGGYVRPTPLFLAVTAPTPSPCRAPARGPISCLGELPKQERNGGPSQDLVLRARGSCYNEKNRYFLIFSFILVTFWHFCLCNDTFDKILLKPESPERTGSSRALSHATTGRSDGVHSMYMASGVTMLITMMEVGRRLGKTL